MDRMTFSHVRAFSPCIAAVAILLSACGGGAESSAESDAARACEGYEAQQAAWRNDDADGAVAQMGEMVAAAESAAATDTEYEPLASAMGTYVSAANQFVSNVESGAEDDSGIDDAMSDVEYECIGL
ncbi:MAG: hypothetical protein ACSLFD_02640 [Solirubrobacterales bacterium]